MRLAEGLDSFRRFAESYAKHPPCHDHDLILLAKGFGKPGEIDALQAIFADLPHRVIAVSDDIGFDIHAYKAAARQLNHSHLVFFNTYSELVSDRWLGKMANCYFAGGVGAVGVTGSYESLHDSVKVVQKMNFLLKRRKLVGLGLGLARFAAKYSTAHRALSKLRRRTLDPSFIEFVRRVIGLSSMEVDEEYQRVWADAVSVGGPFSRYVRFPRFPNPHLRSNGFMIDRAVFLEVPLRSDDKLGCCEFESGYGSLSYRLLERGYRLLVVGADGKGYDIEDWPRSNTFRLDSQENLLALDNQTKNFFSMGTAEKELHRTVTWGGYDRGTKLRLAGIGFEAIAPKKKIASFGARINMHSASPKISVVIPTHNRAHLVAEALSTIVKQPYQNCEIIVFDNASDPPLFDGLRRATTLN